MAFDAEFLTLMTQSVVITPITARDAYGKKTAGTPVTCRARVEFKKTKVRDASGEDQISTCTIYMPPPGYVVGAVTHPTVTTVDLVTLPAGADTSPVPVIVVEPVMDEDGVHHQVIRI